MMTHRERILQVFRGERVDRILVGGAPVNEEFARDIGADGYAHDAGEGVSLVRRLLGSGA